ncbi:hypothetical protein ACHAW6_006326 [Cyclotella cf. meneghiniana]
MESTQAGFFAQLKGKLTTRCYTAATIFVAIILGTIQAKNAFERFAAAGGVHIKQYHFDNGRFVDNAFRQHCDQHSQTTSYCSTSFSTVHCINDDFFETTRYSDRDVITPANWKQLADFVRYAGMLTIQN